MTKDIPSIVLVGHVCIDRNVSENSSYESWGSALMYMAEYCQTQLSIKPTLIAPYGHDFEPYIENITLLPEAQNKPTLVYENRIVNGMRTQRCEHTGTATPVGLSPGLSSALAEADILVVAPLLPNFTLDYLKQLMANGRPDHLNVLLPQGFFRAVSKNGDIATRKFDEALDIISLFDLVILSEEDTPKALEQARQWAQQTQACIVVTQASHGASVVTQNGITHVPTQAVPADQIIDSVGCGDTFSMAAAVSYYQNKDAIVAVKVGNKAARDKLFHANPAK